MSERGTQILKEALSLPPAERAALVEHLLGVSMPLHVSISTPYGPALPMYI